MNTKMTAKVMDNNALNRQVAERLGRKPLIQYAAKLPDGGYWDFSFTRGVIKSQVEDKRKRFPTSPYAESEVAEIEIWPDYCGSFDRAMELRDRIASQGAITQILTFLHSLDESVRERLNRSEDSRANFREVILFAEPSDYCRAFLRATEVQGG